jgi:uncharacterized protein (TIGR00369 family)
LSRQDEGVIIDEPVRGGYPEPWLLALPGSRRIALSIEGHMPYPPMGRLLGTDVVEAHDGRSTATMPATGWLVSPQGRIPIGVLAIVAYIAFGCAVGCELDVGQAFTTAELSLQRLRRPAPGGVLVANGRLLFLEPPVALVEAGVHDSEGHLVAHGTSRLAVFEPAGALPPVPDPLPPLVADRTPVPDDPWRRPPEGTVLGDDVWSSMTGLQVLQAQIAGDLPLPPLSHLTGLRPVEAAEGTADVALPSSEWLNSPGGTMQGGVTAMLADAAMQMAIQTTAAQGDGFAPLDFKVNYLRPVIADDRDLIAHGEVVHRGQQIVVARAEVVNADGKRVALATGSARFVV